MTGFDEIEATAAAHVGGPEALAARLPRAEPPESLAMIGDDRYLSVMCRRIFRAGLTHRLVDQRWPAFEAAFGEFDLAHVGALSDTELQRLARDDTLIRHRRKIVAVRDNAVAMQTLVAEFGSFGFWLAEWPEDEIVELWRELKRRFVQLGGRSAPAFLRMVGKDTFMLTDGVVRALAYWDAHAGRADTRAGEAAIQDRFNEWQASSGRDYCQISQILALSIH